MTVKTVTDELRAAPALDAEGISRLKSPAMPTLSNTDWHSNYVTVRRQTDLQTTHADGAMVCLP